MSRGPQDFKESNLKKAFKVAEKAGYEVSRFEIDPRTGKIVIIVGPRDTISESGSSDANEWDSVT
jgi:hypothetical protein